ncbi:MAG: hypothetical protein ACLGI5_09615 [Thermoleophilia bacterium]
MATTTTAPPAATQHAAERQPGAPRHAATAQGGTPVHAAEPHPGAPPPAGATTPGAIRAFGVMLGGPLVLLGAVAASAAHTVRALRRGRVPRPAAIGVLACAAAYRRRLRPWMRTWGALDAEIEMELPGDELSPHAPFAQTHAVEIDAPADAVWAWVAQIGQDRGGFYSYTWLENLAGCGMRNADRIHREWQQRRVGETVLLHPASGLRIMRIEPGRALVLEGGWSLHVEPDGPGSCRLIARFRAPAGLAGTAYALLLELPHFVMERRMLLQIKHRAEGRR